MNNDGQQFHQYQQSQLNIEKTTMYDICLKIPKGGNQNP
jgi:hypothetical protein